MPYRLIIVAPQKGITEGIVWEKFPTLVPLSHTDQSVTYTCRLSVPLNEAQKQIMDGWVEDGDILSYEIKPLEETDNKAHG